MCGPPVCIRVYPRSPADSYARPTLRRWIYAAGESSYPQIVMVFPTVDNHVDNAAGPARTAWAPGPPGPRYFHCVDTPNPPAMKAKPMTMFQLPMAEIGQAALDT